MKWMLWGSVIWLAPFMVYLMVNEAKFKKNICIGVTLPQEAHDNAMVQETSKAYAKESWIACGVLVVLGVVWMLLGNQKSMMTLWGIWVFLCIIVPYIPYFRAHRRLKEIKMECGWLPEKSSLTVDTSALSERKWLSPWLFAPAGVLCALPMLQERDLWQVSLLYLAMVMSCWLGYRYLYRNKAEMVDANGDLTKALTVMRRHNWGQVWLMTAYGLAGYRLAQWLAQFNALGSIIMFVIITVAICVLAMKIEMNTRRQQEFLTANSGGEWYVDDDEHWLGGILYYNPNDTRFLINSRIGVNSTINLATVPGKIMAFFAVLVLAALPFFGVWMDAMGNSEIAITTQNETIVATNGFSKYEVDRQDIQEVQLLEQLPQNLTREMGTGLDSLLKGRFSSKEHGALTVLCDPGCPPFILVKTSRKTYLLGTRDAKETERLYEEWK